MKRTFGLIAVKIDLKQKSISRDVSVLVGERFTQMAANMGCSAEYQQTVIRSSCRIQLRYLLIFHYFKDSQRFGQLATETPINPLTYGKIFWRNSMSFCVFDITFHHLLA